MAQKGKITTWLKAAPVWLVAFTPLIVSIIFQAVILMDFRYPTIDPIMLGFYLILMLISIAPVPVLLVCWFMWLQWRDRGRLRWPAAILCALWLPVTLFTQGMIGFACPIYSETSNPAHYLKLNDWGAAKTSFIFELFPAQPRTVTLVKDETGCTEQPAEVLYYYRDADCVDHIYEVYAQWTLPAAELEEERLRVEALFAEKSDNWHVETIQRGRFVCMMCYWQDRPFSNVLSYYTQAIFAYDMETGVVRYIYCEGVDAKAQPQFAPIYLTMDW